MFQNNIPVGGYLIDIMALFVDATAWVSPIGVADIPDWQILYGVDVAGAVQDNGDGTYIG